VDESVVSDLLPGRPESSGLFTLDLSRRREAYESINLHSPHAYMLKLLQAVTECAPERIAAQVGAAEIRLHVPDARFGREQLASLHAFLDRGEGCGGSFGLACLLLSCRPDLQFSLEVAEQRLQFDARACRLLPGAAADGMIVSVRATGKRPAQFAPSLWRVNLFSWRVGLFWPEWVRTLDLWRFPPVRLTVNGAEFEPAYFGRRTAGARWVVAQGYLVAKNADANRVRFPVQPDLPQRPIYTAGRDDDGVPVPALESVRAVWGWRAKLRHETTGRGTLFGCAQGFVLQTYPIYASGLSMVLDLSNHPVDASGIRFVQSSALEARIVEFERRVQDDLRDALRWVDGGRRKRALQRMLNSIVG
jgi:hypothetical protein